MARFLNACDHTVATSIIGRHVVQQELPIHYGFSVVAVVEVIGTGHHQSFPIGRILLKDRVDQLPGTAAQILTLNHSDRVCKVSHHDRVSGSDLIGALKRTGSLSVVLHREHAAAEHHPAVEITGIFSEMRLQFLKRRIHVMHFTGLTNHLTGGVVRDSFVAASVKTEIADMLRSRPETCGKKRNQKEESNRRICADLGISTLSELFRNRLFQNTTLKLGAALIKFMLRNRAARSLIFKLFELIAIDGQINLRQLIGILVPLVVHNQRNRNNQKKDQSHTGRRKNKGQH